MIEPIILVKCLFVGIGLIFGSIVTFISWRINSKDKNMFEDPKLQGAIYIFFSSLVIFIGDWKGIFTEAFAKGDLDKTTVAGLYLLGAFFGLLIALISYTVLVLKKYKAKNLIDFYAFGYEFVYHNSKDSETERLEQALLITDDCSKRAATNLCLIANYINNPNIDLKNSLIQHVLNDICGTITPLLRSGKKFKINANYMETVEAGDISDLSGVKYTFGDNNRYSHYLVLKTYAQNNHVANNDLILPVENKIKLKNKLKIIPGAPNALFTGKPKIVILPIQKYPQKIPKSVQNDITDYFKSQDFINFISIPIPVSNKNRPIGIVNIETNQSKMREYSADLIEENLLPLTTTLGLLLKCR